MYPQCNTTSQESSQPECGSTSQVPTTAKGLISAEVLSYFELYVLVILTGFICWFGMVSNIINIVIFFKQGLNDTINISLFGLAISDLLVCLTLEWNSTCFNPLFINSGIPWDTKKVMHLTGAWPHLWSGRISCWITTYIAAERCLCIALPMTVKQIITPKRTIICISLIYFTNFLIVIPAYISARLDWRFYAEKNMSLITMVLTEDGATLDAIAFFLFAAVGTVTFPFLIIFTVFIVIRLRCQSKWRQNATQDGKQMALTSRRDVKTMTMVGAVAGILIACYSPGVFSGVMVFIVPSFSATGINVNLFYVVWTFVAMLAAVNSSVNIFVYYNMSTKYRKTFNEILCRPCNKNFLERD